MIGAAIINLGTIGQVATCPYKASTNVKIALQKKYEIKQGLETRIHCAARNEFQPQIRFGASVQGAKSPIIPDQAFLVHIHLCKKYCNLF